MKRRGGKGDVDFADIQVNETDFKRITHKDALAALRASDKVKGRRKGQNSKICFSPICTTATVRTLLASSNQLADGHPLYSFLHVATMPEGRPRAARPSINLRHNAIAP